MEGRKESDRTKRLSLSEKTSYKVLGTLSYEEEEGHQFGV